MGDVNITGTVKDSDGVVWAGAAWAAKIIGYVSTGGRLPTYITTGQPVDAFQSGSTDANGNLAFSAASNDVIVPTGTLWQITIQPTAPVEPSIVRFHLAQGASLDISGILTQQITPLSAEGGTPPQPKILQAANQAAAITESEQFPNNIYWWL